MKGETAGMVPKAKAPERPLKQFELKSKVQSKMLDFTYFNLTLFCAINCLTGSLHKGL